MTLSLIAVGIVVGLPRWPTPTWYLAMSLVGLGFLGTLAGPNLSGLLLVAGLGYLGWTGRQALTAVYGRGPDRAGSVVIAPTGATADRTAEEDATTIQGSDDAEPATTADHATPATPTPGVESAERTERATDVADQGNESK